MSSDYKLAIKIAGELDSSLASAVKSAQSMLNGLNGGKKSGFAGVMESAGKAAANGMKTLMQMSAGSLTVMAGAAAAASKAAIDTGMDFESAMSNLAGTAGISTASEEFAQLEAAARQVGATTNKTATESAEALRYMALAGWSTEDSISALDDMVKLSSASGVDLARTSDLVTDSMGALGLGMNDYASYMDMVAQADSAANYSADQFMETMIGAGGSARLLGVDVKDLAAAAGVLANNGTKGSEAGTALNGMFTRLAKNSKPVAESLAAIGVSLDDGNGNFKAFPQMLADIKTGLAGVEDNTQRAAIAANLFGTNYQSEAQYLLDSIQIMEDGSVSFGAFADELANAYDGVDANGDAIDVLGERYATATDNLKGDLDTMKSAASDFGIEIYKAIVGDGEGGGLRGAVQEVTTIIGDLKTAFQVEGLSGLADGIADAIGDVSTKIAEKAPQAIQDAQQFASKLITELGNTENADAIGSAVSGIVTNLGAGFLTYTGDFAVAAGNIMLGITNALAEDDVGARIGEAASGMVSKIGTWFSENGAEFGTAAGQLVTSLATGITSHAGELLNAGIDIIVGLGEGIIAAVPIIVGQLPTIIADLVNGFLQAVPNILSAGAALGVALIKGIADSIANLKDTIRDAIDSLVDEDFGQGTEFYMTNEQAIQQLTQTRLDGNQQISDSERALVQQMVDGGQKAYMALQEAMTTMEPEAQAEAAAASQLYAQYLAEAGQELKEHPELMQEMAQATQEASAAAESQTGVYDEMLSEATAAAQGTAEASGQASDALSTIQSEAESVKTSVSGIGEALSGDITEGLSANALSALIESIDTGNIDQVVAQLNSAMTEIQTATSTATTQVSADFTSMGSTVSTTGSQAVADCQAAASGITSAFAAVNLSSIASAMMAGLTAGIRAGGQAAVAAARSIASEIASVMRSALQIHSPSRVMEGIGEFIPAGLAVGMQAGIPDVQSATRSLADSVATNDFLSYPLRQFNAGYDAAPAPVGQAPAEGGAVINFAPQITITGNASQQDVQNALQWSMEEFRRMYERMQADDRRMSFA